MNNQDNIVPPAEWTSGNRYVCYNIPNDYIFLLSYITNGFVTEVFFTDKDRYSDKMFVGLKGETILDTIINDKDTLYLGEL